jgi:hypothetical protein
MSVVVNEFEVVPESETAPPPDDAVLERPSIDIERDVMRALDLERARGARLHAC